MHPFYTFEYYRNKYKYSTNHREFERNRCIVLPLSLPVFIQRFFGPPHTPLPHNSFRFEKCRFAPLVVESIFECMQLLCIHSALQSVFVFISMSLALILITSPEEELLIQIITTTRISGLVCCSHTTGRCVIGTKTLLKFWKS